MSYTIPPGIAGPSWRYSRFLDGVVNLWLRQRLGPCGVGIELTDWTDRLARTRQCFVMSDLYVNDDVIKNTKRKQYCKIRFCNDLRIVLDRL